MSVRVGVDLDFSADATAEEVEPLHADGVEEAACLAAVGPDHHEVPLFVHAHCRLELRIRGVEVHAGCVEVA